VRYFGKKQHRLIDGMYCCGLFGEEAMFVLSLI